MAGINQTLVMVIVATFLIYTTCLTQAAPTSTDSSSTVHTSSALPSPITGIGCMTGGGDARMDSFVVKRLSTLYCDKLFANFPSFTGENFTAAEYPTDLGPLSNNPNYTILEQEGFIAVFGLTIASSYVDDNNTIHIQGQKSQCASDNCTLIFDAIVNRCMFASFPAPHILCRAPNNLLGEWNSHYFGGYNQHISPCGTYSVYTLNCTDNIYNPGCSRWHSKWQPFYNKTSTSSTYSATHYTNTDYYEFTWTEAGATLTSEVMVSTVTGKNWTSITPMIFTMDSTYTGYGPNPTYDGPTFSPRFSTGISMSSSVPTLMTTSPVIPLPIASPS